MWKFIFLSCIGSPETSSPKAAMTDAQWPHEPSLLLSNVLVVQLPSLSSLHGPRRLPELQLLCPCSSQQEGRRWKSKKSAVISFLYVSFPESHTIFCFHPTGPTLIAQPHQVRKTEKCSFFLMDAIQPQIIFMCLPSREKKKMNIGWSLAISATVRL